jgi:heme exporter protein A
MQPAPGTGSQSILSGRPGTADDLSDIPAVEAQLLVRKFGNRKVVSGVTFSVRQGETLCIFGPNGAGKTTLLRVLAGILAPSTGHASIGGVAISEKGSTRGRSGLVTHSSMLYCALSAVENVEFAARMHGVDSPRAASQAALARIGAGRTGNIPVRFLSRGQQQRVSIARSLVHSPSVLLLDEPFAGLDEPGSQQLTQLLAELRAGGAAMIVVTHNLAEGLALADQCAIMLKGNFVRLEPRAGIDSGAYSALYHDVVSHGA